MWRYTEPNATCVLFNTITYTREDQSLNRLWFPLELCKPVLVVLFPRKLALHELHMPRAELDPVPHIHLNQLNFVPMNYVMHPWSYTV